MNIHVLFAFVSNYPLYQNSTITDSGVLKRLRSLQSAVLPPSQEGQPTPFPWIISAQRPLVVQNWYCCTQVCLKC